MTITCTLRTPWRTEEMRTLFATELERQHSQSKVALEDDGGHASFIVTANDVTALRASLNGITTILNMHEKTIEATHDSD